MRSSVDTRMTAGRRVEISIDGASRGNPGPAGVGVVFTASDGTIVRELSKAIGETTNNVAEYLALLYALQEALKGGYTSVAVNTDSELLAFQLTGRYKVRDATLRVFHDLALHLIQGFRQFDIRHIPREQNRRADRLASHAARP